MLIGISLLATQHEVSGQTPGVGMITDHGGVLPHGVMPVVLVMQGVIFSYAALELVGVAAGETAEPHKIVPPRGELDHVAGGRVLRRLGRAPGPAAAEFALLG
ncbi:hypothetical protein SVIOM342S_03270 [Streptomyces violaceorubidus]